MREVQLIAGIQSSALGFGCAPILGSVDPKKAERALDLAYDYGITHFDLARSYGYGEAEKFFGKIMKERRSNIVLATKFGIQANWKASILRPLKPMLRIIRINGNKKENSIVTNSNKTVADRFLDRIPLEGSAMRNSLEKSLRALSTDYVDFLFIHEPKEKLVHIDELISTAQLLKDEGKIRAWGISYMRSNETVHKVHFNQFDVLQFDNAFGAQGYNQTVIERGLKANVLFSPLRGGTNKLNPQEKLKHLFHDFPNSVVLCSMFNEQHLKNNIALVS